MTRHFLLDYLRRDLRNTLMLSLAALAVGTSLVLLPEEPAWQVAGAVAVASSLFGFYLGRHALHPERERSVRALARYGDVGATLRDLQEQFEAGPVVEFGRIRVLRDWVTGCGIGIAVVRFDELVGVRERETEHRNWEVLLYARDGRCERLHCPHKFAALALLPLIRMRAPWARGGEDLERRWREDRGALLAEVEEARRVLEPLVSR